MTSKKQGIQLPKIVKKAKADPTASDDFTERGSKVIKQDVTATKSINLVLDVPMVDAIDKVRQPQPPKSYTKMNRTAWIKQAIAEKLERDS